MAVASAARGGSHVPKGHLHLCSALVDQKVRDVRHKAQRDDAPRDRCHRRDRQLEQEDEGDEPPTLETDWTDFGTRVRRSL